MTETVDVSAAPDAGAAKPRGRRRSASRRPAGGPPKATPRATHKQLHESVAKYLTMASFLYASYVTNGLDDDPDVATLTDDEAEAISEPFTKLIERSSVSKYATSIVESEDWLVAGAAMLSYVQRVAPVQRKKTQSKPSTPASPTPIRRKARNSERPGQNETAQPSAGGFGNVGGIQPTAGGYGLGVQHGVDL